ncbi:hypothetical protein V8F06_010642 [Rhypophila decipiens]
MGDTPLHVIIVGAGLAGIAIAHGLQKHNIAYTLVERETTPRDRNWGITLSWALPLLESLLPPSLANRACSSEMVSLGRSSCVRFILEGFRRMQIQKTKRVLSTGLSNLQYGKRLINLSYPSDGLVTAHFDDGSAITGNVVIGVDGRSSKVRRCLLSEEAAAQEVLPYAFMNFPFRLPAEKERWLDSTMNPSVDVAPHPKKMYMGLFLLDKPELEKPETWVFYILATWAIACKEDEENTENRLERLRAHMDGWADPYKSVVDWLARVGDDNLIADKLNQ